MDKYGFRALTDWLNWAPERREFTVPQLHVMLPTFLLHTCVLSILVCLCRGNDDLIRCTSKKPLPEFEIFAKADSMKWKRLKTDDTWMFNRDLPNVNRLSPIRTWLYRISPQLLYLSILNFYPHSTTTTFATFCCSLPAKYILLAILRLTISDYPE